MLFVLVKNWKYHDVTIKVCSMYILTSKHVFMHLRAFSEKFWGAPLHMGPRKPLSKIDHLILEKSSFAHFWNFIFLARERPFLKKLNLRLFLIWIFKKSQNRGLTVSRKSAISSKVSKKLLILNLGWYAEICARAPEFLRKYKMQIYFIFTDVVASKNMKKP